MPYFRWHGVGLSGSLRSGKLFACSQKELDDFLLKRDIALLKSVPITPWVVRPLSLTRKIYFFKQLSTLLTSGVLLPDALVILIYQMNNVPFQIVLQKVSEHIRDGLSLSQSVQKYPAIFSSLMVKMVHIGEEAGTLPGAINALSTYLEAKDTFSKKIKSIIFLPMITLLFFMCIAFVIFTIIIPLFATVFESLGKDVPASTNSMLQISYFLRQNYMLIIVGVIATIFFARAISRYKRVTLFLDAFKLKIPIVNRIVSLNVETHFLQTMTLLLSGGMHVVPALRIACQSVANTCLQKQIEQIEHAVESGSSLSRAMVCYAEPLFSHDILSMVQVGEESGKLPSMLNEAAQVSFYNMQHLLSLVSMVVQPLLLIGLGFLIGLLIFSVYMPILELSYSV